MREKNSNLLAGLRLLSEAKQLRRFKKKALGLPVKSQPADQLENQSDVFYHEEEMVRKLAYYDAIADNNNILKRMFTYGFVHLNYAYNLFKLNVSSIFSEYDMYLLQFIEMTKAKHNQIYLNEKNTLEALADLDHDFDVEDLNGEYFLQSLWAIYSSYGKKLTDSKEDRQQKQQLLILLRLISKYNDLPFQPMHVETTVQEPVLIEHSDNDASIGLNTEILKTFDLFKTRLNENIIYGNAARYCSEWWSGQKANDDLYEILLLLYRENLFTESDQKALIDAYYDNSLSTFNINDSKQIQTYRKAQACLLDVLYQKFDVLADSEQNEFLLKVLKKQINAFAEKNGFAKRLFNLDKLALDEAKHDYLADVTQHSSDKKRKYAYIKTLINEVEPEKIARRKWKKVINAVATIISLILSVNEAAITFFFSGPVSLLFKSTIVGSSFVSTFILFRSAIVHTTKQLFFKGFFTDQHGLQASPLKKFMIGLSTFFCMGSGACMGVFTFMTVASILATIGCPPVGVAILAGVLGGLSAIGVMYLFMYSFANFVKNDTYLDVIRYFKTTYTIPAYDGDSLIGECAHVANHLLQNTIRAICLAGAGFAWVALACAGGPFFARAVANVCINKLHLLARVSGLIGRTVSFGFATPLNTFFAARGMFETADLLAGFIINIPYLIERMFHSALMKKIGNWLGFVSDETIASLPAGEVARDIHAVTKSAASVVLMAMPIPSAYAQKNTFPSNHRSVQVVSQLTGLPSTETVPLLKGIGFFGAECPSAMSLTKTLMPPSANTNAIDIASIRPKAKS